MWVWRLWPWLWSWLMASCDWVGGVHLASRLITLQHQRAISWGGGGGGGWVVFSVPVSLHQHQREISMLGLPMWVCKWVYLPLLLPPLSLCFWACVAEERKRWDVVIGTLRHGLFAVQWWWVDPVERCGVCTEWACQTWKVCDEALREGERGGVQNSWGTGALVVPIKNQPGLGPVLCYPGPGSQPD